jgi:hypothetical protein
VRREAMGKAEVKGKQKDGCENNEDPSRFTENF